MLLMGKLTISTGPCSMSQTVKLPEGTGWILVGLRLEGLEFMKLWDFYMDL